ncbi:hypothetical protein NL329_29775, partial [Klebsiella pneumoniae]|nr:hypothetical protein [Klebsiella pneumoniae]
RKARPHYSLSEALDEVLELVWPSRDRIKVFTKDKDLRIGVTCTVKILTDRPLYDLRVKSISRLADLQSEFFLDIMDYSE